MSGFKIFRNVWVGLECLLRNILATTNDCESRLWIIGGLCLNMNKYTISNISVDAVGKKSCIHCEVLFLVSVDGEHAWRRRLLCRRRYDQDLRAIGPNSLYRPSWDWQIKIQEEFLH
jgi:hypothetical protein